jgi:1,4-alpha-glucan branching enzyme
MSTRPQDPSASGSEPRRGAKKAARKVAGAMKQAATKAGEVVAGVEHELTERSAPAKATVAKATEPVKATVAKATEPVEATVAKATEPVEATVAKAPATPVSPPSPAPVSWEELDRLRGGAHHDPHSILGPHPGPRGVTFRVMAPGAEGVVVLVGTPGTPITRLPLAHEHAGVWVGVFPTANDAGVPDYRLAVYRGGVESDYDDPYRYLPSLGEMDLYLIGEGRHEQLWTVLGANRREYSGPTGTVTGTSFAVWAPSARGVRVSADFNFWNPVTHPMRSLGSAGVWELFVPEVGNGTHYKLEVLGADGVWRTKSDPMASWAEVAPDTASRVFTSDYTWNDAEWLEGQSHRNIYKSPMSIYEVHLGSWRVGLSYEQLAVELVDYVRDLGFTHVEFLPVSEHPFGGSWGYQVSGYYAPTARFGSPDEFRALVDALHTAGIGVIVDWVPGHFPRDEWSLARFDGTALYEHPDPRRGEQPDWGTYVFNFGRNEVRNFLVANAVYWLEEFHIDGLRVDAVASMLYLDYSREEGQWAPNAYGGRENLEAVAFLQETNATVYRRVPRAIMIAEESTAWPGVTRATDSGGLGFGFKWNMGWMHDTLDYIARDPIHRRWHHNEMTFSAVYAYSENFILPISHDEVVHGKGSLLGKMPGDRWRQFANLRAYLAYMWAHPGKQLLFMGSELGQGTEWSESRSLDWYLMDYPEHAGINSLVRDLNHVYTANPAMYVLDHQPTGFSWIDADDADGNTLSFLRFGDDGSVVACVANFAAMPHHDRRIGLPFAGRWAEILNTDAREYGGSGVGNSGAVVATEEPWLGFRASASIQLPPLGTIWLRYEPGTADTDAE